MPSLIFSVSLWLSAGCASLRWLLCQAGSLHAVGKMDSGSLKLHSWSLSALKM